LTTKYINLDEKAFGKLQEIKNWLGIRSNTETVRYLINQYARDENLILHDEAGKKDLSGMA